VLAGFTGCPAAGVEIELGESPGLSFSFDIKNESSAAKSITVKRVYFFENILLYGEYGLFEDYSNNSFEAGKEFTVSSDRMGVRTVAIFSFLLTIDGEIYAGWRKEDKHPGITSDPVEYELGYLINTWDDVSQLFPYMSKLQPENDKRHPVNYAYETYIAYKVTITDEKVSFVLEMIDMNPES
jgi:hypothetical protein